VANLSELLKEKDRTGARVIGAAQNALWFFEAQDFQASYAILKSALDAHNEATRALYAYYQQEENSDGNRSAAA
jgi:hypothetical protein